MDSDEYVSGGWDVDVDLEYQSVCVQLSHVSEAGVESFVTSMPKQHALDFAAAIISRAEMIP